MMQIKLIFTTKISHLASFWKWDFLELGNGLFCDSSDFQVPFKNSYEGTSSKEKFMHKHTQAACELEPSNLIVD